MTSTRIACIGICAAAAVVAGGDAASGAASPTLMTLKVAFDRSSQVHVDVGKKGPSPGDLYGGAAGLERDGRAYGRMELIDHSVDSRYEGALQSGVLILPKGQLAFQGAGVNRPVPGVRPSRADAFAIVGGTGSYTGAGGTMTIESGNRLVVRLSR